MPDKIQYDGAVVEWAESTLRTHLDATVIVVNDEIVANASLTDITVASPVDSSIVARDESDLDERGHRPQHTEGVWCRVTDSVDQDTLAFQPMITEHKLSVRVFVKCTDEEDPAGITIMPTGYKRVMYLARAVHVALGENLDCPNFGVINLTNDGGSRIPRALRGMPSTHVIDLTFSITQRTYRPIGVA